MDDVAEECNRVLGQAFMEDEGSLMGDLLGAARERELDAWKQIEVARPPQEAGNSKSVADTRRVLTQKMLGV